MTKFSRFLTAFAAAAVWMVVVAGAPVMAQTADGFTPSEDTICDSQVGKAFGFCNAYCEAMDCDSEDANASLDACSKVKDKFMEATNGGELPCESDSEVAGVCPCSSFSGDNFAAAGIIENATNNFLTNSSCGLKASDLALCLDSITCEVTDPTGEGDTVILVKTTLESPPADLFEWRLFTGKTDLGYHCEVSVDTSPPSEDLVFRNFRHELWLDRAAMITWSYPGFTQQDLEACTLLKPDAIDHIEKALGELVGNPDFTCSRL